MAPGQGEGTHYNKRGAILHTLLSVSETRDGQGKRDGFVMICRDITEWKKAEEKLRQFNRELEAQVAAKTAAISRSNAELRALASHLQDIREEERASMAREIHDELGQQLTGLKMDLALIAKRYRSATMERLGDDLTATMGLLDTTIRTVRKLATELRPSILDDLGLLAAIDWQSQEFERRSGIPTRFHAGPATLDLPPSVAIGLFRICQESLTNVARHADASHVDIALEQAAAQLTLTIRDDGKGLDPRDRDPGETKTLGLLGMKERALMMGGRLDIVSRPGEGLTLSVTIPLT